MRVSTYLLPRRGRFRPRHDVREALMENTYETPEVTELGSLEDLTLLCVPKFIAETDGFSFQGQDIGQPS
jgi:hypothetical protein